MPADRDTVRKTRPARPDEPLGIINGISGSEHPCSIERRRKKSQVRSAVSAPASRRGEAPGARANARSYRVRPGDTLFGVARRFGMSVDALCAANGISRGASLSAGQRLRIPSGVTMRHRRRGARERRSLQCGRALRGRLASSGP